MSLSSQVKEAVNQAAEHLRDALAFAARSEHPMTIATISDLLVRLESVESMDQILEKFGHGSKQKEDSPFGWRTVRPLLCMVELSNSQATPWVGVEYETM